MRQAPALALMAGFLPDEMVLFHERQGRAPLLVVSSDSDAVGRDTLRRIPTSAKLDRSESLRQ